MNNRHGITWAFLEDKPSLRPPTAEQSQQRKKLRDEIEAMTLYGIATDADKRAAKERVKYRTCWSPMKAPRLI